MTAARRTQLARLGIWIGLATVAVLTAVLTARTETGLRRIATLLSGETPEAVRSARIAGPQIASRQFDQDGEQRRLNETVRTLAADRDRLASRLAALERNLDDVTGSIAKPNTQTPAAPSQPRPAPQVQATPAPSSPPQTSNAPVPAPQAVPTVPAAQAIAPPVATTPPAAQVPTQAPNQVPSRVASGHLATGTPTASDSVATKTEFGIDVGGNATVEGLRTLWTSLKASQPVLFDGLRPVVAVREGQKPGTIELRLIAGPIANAGIAARMCAALSAMNQACQPAVFDGQRLASQ